MSAYSRLLRVDLSSRDLPIHFGKSARAVDDFDAADARLRLAAESEFVFFTKADHSGNTPKVFAGLPDALTILRRKADGSTAFTDREKGKIGHDHNTHVALSLTPDRYRLPIYRLRNDPKHEEFVAVLREYKRTGEGYLLASIIFNREGWLQDTNNQYLFADCVRLRHAVSDDLLQKLFHAVGPRWDFKAAREYVRQFRPLPRRPGGRIGRAICEGPTKKELRDQVAKIKRLQNQYFRRFTE